MTESSISLKKWLQGSTESVAAEDGARIGISSGGCNDQDLTTSSQQLTTPPQVLLLDGGVSTHLEQILMRKKEEQQNDDTHSQDKNTASSPFQYRELWSSSLLLSTQGQNEIRNCHLDFLDAGSNIISTVTYQVHYMPILQETSTIKEEENAEKLKLDDKVVDQLLIDGVRLAKEAINEYNNKQANNSLQSHSYVAASIGSIGGALADGSEYTGSFKQYITIEKMIQFHKRKTQIMMKQQPDTIAFETIPCVDEVIAILSLLQQLHNEQEISSSIPAVWISLACCDGEHLTDETKVVDVLSKINELDPESNLVQAIGINCCSCKHVRPLLEKLVNFILQSDQSRGIVFYPNSGETWNATTETWLEGTGVTNPEDFANQIMSNVRYILETMNMNKKTIQIIVGGCCRTTPETISAIRSQLDLMMTTI